MRLKSLRIVAIRNNLELARNEFISLLSYVSPEKSKKLINISNRCDAQNSLMGDLLVRREVCRLTGLKNSELKFIKNKFGKPYLANFPGIYFNVSHTDNLVIVVFDRAQVGIDIELIKPINFGMTKWVFSTEEYNHFNRLSIVEKQNYFYRIWTMKEAYLKKEGLGLTIPMKIIDAKVIQFVKFFLIHVNEKVFCHVCTSGDRVLAYREESLHDLVNYYSFHSLGV
jgi:4'-phosphopantetheinyl transferase